MCNARNLLLHTTSKWRAIPVAKCRVDARRFIGVYSRDDEVIHAIVASVSTNGIWSAEGPVADESKSESASATAI
jgi:hypothetical protein